MIYCLQEALRTAKNEADDARRDAEMAKVSAIAELSEAHRGEIAEVRGKLDTRTEELLRIRQENGSLQLQLQAAQAEIKALKQAK